MPDHLLLVLTLTTILCVGCGDKKAAVDDKNPVAPPSAAVVISATPPLPMYPSVVPKTPSAPLIRLPPAPAKPSSQAPRR